MVEREDSAELLALQRIDETCTKLQQQGNYLEALECMERGLVLRQHFFGADSDEVWRACKTVGEMCNLLAMTYLQQEDFAMVLELLKKAEILTERDPPGRAVTFNNLACYYRRQGKLHAALQYLQKALKIESRIERVQNPADTHLNCCAVLSQLGRHQSALEHAQSALILLQEELFRGLGSNGGGEEGKAALPKADRIAVLAIAYHNIGVEQEFLKKFEQSLASYRKGVEIADKYLGPTHAITVTLRNSSIAAKRAIVNRDPKGKPKELPPTAHPVARKDSKGSEPSKASSGGNKAPAAPKPLPSTVTSKPSPAPKTVTATPSPPPPHKPAATATAPSQTQKAMSATNPPSQPSPSPEPPAQTAQASTLKASTLKASTLKASTLKAAPPAPDKMAATGEAPAPAPEAKVSAF